MSTVFESAESIDMRGMLGATFRSRKTPGTYYLLSGYRTIYGARAIEFRQINRGRITNVVISDGAMKRAGVFPLELVWELPEEERSFDDVFTLSDQYVRGVPLRVHLERKHARETGALALAGGVL